MYYVIFSKIVVVFLNCFLFFFRYIPRTLELFVESILTKTLKITNTRNAKTLSPSHLKQCIMAEQRFDFLRELVKNIPDISLAEEAAANYNDMDDVQSSPEQDSFSDAASEHNKSNDMLQRPTTSSTTTTTNGSDDIKLRRTRSMQHEMEIVERLQQQHATTTSPTGMGVIMHTNKLMPTAVEAKRTKSTHTHTHTAAIPAPIVSYDFCSKPVVKLDYSNVPQSAPAHIVPPMKQMFDFSQLANPSASASASTSAISINIDLSSIKINKSTNSSSSSHSHTDTVSSTTTTTTTTTNIMPKAHVKPNTTTAAKLVVTTTKDTLLELDEDYDNI